MIFERRYISLQKFVLFGENPWIKYLSFNFTRVKIINRMNSGSGYNTGSELNNIYRICIPRHWKKKHGSQ